MGMFDFVPVIGDLLAGKLNNDAANQRQADANTFSAQQYATRWQTTVKDMDAAGLNPMLAYSQGVGSSPSGGIASSPGYQGIGSTINQSKLASAQVANIAADTENKKASADLIAAQAASSWASAGQSDAQTSLIRETAQKVIQETANARTEGQRLGSALNLLDQQRENLVKDGYNITEQGNVLRATVSKILAEVPNLKAQFEGILNQNSLSGFDVKAARSSDNFGREAGQYKPLLDLLSIIMGARRH